MIVLFFVEPKLTNKVAYCLRLSRRVRQRMSKRLLFPGLLRSKVSPYFSKFAFQKTIESGFK